MVHSPALCSLDANRRGPRSPRNEQSQLQWRALRAQLGTPGPEAPPCSPRPRPAPVSRAPDQPPRLAPPPRRARCAPPPRPLPGQARGTATASRGNTRTSRSTPPRQPKLFLSSSVYDLGIRSKDDLGQPCYSIEPDPGAQRLEEGPGALPETASLCSIAVRQAGKSGRLGSVGQEFKSRV